MEETRKNTLAVMASKGDDELITPGEVVDMRLMDANGQSRGLSLRAHKLLHQLIEQAGQQIAVESAKHVIDVAAVNEGHHLSAEDLHAHIVELIGTVITLEVVKDGHKAIEYGAFLSKATRFTDGYQKIEYKFSDLMREVFLSSTHWAALNAKALHAFQSGYALRLYEMITLRQGRKQYQETFDIGDLRSRLGVPSGKLKTWHNFRTKALERACDEVNAFSGAVVTWEAKKRGRAVSQIVISWRRKDDDERQETAKLLDRTKAERTSRTKGATQRHREALEAKATALAASMPTHQASMLDDDEITY